MKVEVTYGNLGWPTYHIWDNDNREIACSMPALIELVRKLLEYVEVPV